MSRFWQKMFFSGSEIKARAVKKETKIMESVVPNGVKISDWGRRNS